MESEARRSAVANAIFEQNISIIYDGLTALMLSSILGDQSSMIKLIEMGSDVNCRDLTHNSSALEFSIRNDTTECAKILIESGAHINDVKNIYDKTPLMMSSYFGSIEMTEILLRAGADPQVIDSNGNDAIDVAIKFGYNSKKIREVILCHINMLYDYFIFLLSDLGLPMEVSEMCGDYLV